VRLKIIFFDPFRQQAAEKVILLRLLKSGQMQVELREIPFRVQPRSFAADQAGNPKSGVATCKERLFCHAREKVSGLHNAADGRFSATC